MKSITQFVAVSLIPALVSGCMCMMPMEKMEMGKVIPRGEGTGKN